MENTAKIKIYSSKQNDDGYIKIYTLKYTDEEKMGKWRYTCGILVSVGKYFDFKISLVF